MTCALVPATRVPLNHNTVPPPAPPGVPYSAPPRAWLYRLVRGVRNGRGLEHGVGPTQQGGGRAAFEVRMTEEVCVHLLTGSLVSPVRWRLTTALFPQADSPEVTQQGGSRASGTGCSFQRSMGLWSGKAALELDGTHWCLSEPFPRAWGCRGLRPAGQVCPTRPASQEHRRLGPALATAHRASGPGQRFSHWAGISCSWGRRPEPGSCHSRSPTVLATPPPPARTRTGIFPNFPSVIQNYIVPFKNSSSLIGSSSARHCWDCALSHLIRIPPSEGHTHSHACFTDEETEARCWPHLPRHTDVGAPARIQPQIAQSWDPREAQNGLFFFFSIFPLLIF